MLSVLTTTMQDCRNSCNTKCKQTSHQWSFLFFFEKKTSNQHKRQHMYSKLGQNFFYLCGRSIVVVPILYFYLSCYTWIQFFGLNQTRNNIILTPQKSKSYLGIVVFDKFLWQVTNFDLSDMRQVQKQMNDVDEYSKWHFESLMLAYKSR